MGSILVGSWGHEICLKEKLTFDRSGFGPADIQVMAATSASAPDAAVTMASTSASVIGVDSAINPLPAASTPRLSRARWNAD